MVNEWRAAIWLTAAGFLLFVGRSAGGAASQAPPGKAAAVIGSQSSIRSVMILDVSGDGLQLSSLREGVVFDWHGSGKLTPTAWTLRNSDDAFLILDGNRNNRVDSGQEMLGTGLNDRRVPQPSNGFNALMYLQGGTRTGNGPIVPPPGPDDSFHIDGRDAVLHEVSLWTDSDHDGRTGPGELVSADSAGLVRILLSFQGLQTPSAGSLIRYRGTAEMMLQGFGRPRPLYDVALAYQ